MQDPVEKSKSAKGGLIRDINRHAAVVMDGMPDSLPADANDAAATLAAASPVSPFLYRLLKSAAAAVPGVCGKLPLRWVCVSPERMPHSLGAASATSWKVGVRKL